MPSLKELAELNRIKEEAPTPKKTTPKAKPKPKPKEDPFSEEIVEEGDIIEADEIIEKPEENKSKSIKHESVRKYPLETIPITKSQLSDPMILDEAKQRILNDIHLYNFTLKNIVNDDDFVLINGNQHLCKSGTRKIQLALNISTEIIDEDIQTIDGICIAKYRVRATAPNGRFAEATGACVQNEKGRSRTYHDTIATAETRTTSRAVMNLVGWGAVTSEEINDESENSGDLF